MQTHQKNGGFKLLFKITFINLSSIILLVTLARSDLFLTLIRSDENFYVYSRPATCSNSSCSNEIAVFSEYDYFDFPSGNITSESLAFDLSSNGRNLIWAERSNIYITDLSRLLILDLPSNGLPYSSLILPSPVFSPSSLSFAFITFDNLNLTINVVIFDSRRRLQYTVPLPNGSSVESLIAWSPNERFIALQANSLQESVETEDIFLIDITSMELIDLTRNAAEDTSPSWSHSGEYISFLSNRGGDEQIYVMNLDGTMVRQITSTDGSKIRPVWLSNDFQIAFQGYSTEHKAYIGLVDIRTSEITIVYETLNIISFDIISDGSEVIFTRTDNFLDVELCRLTTMSYQVNCISIPLRNSVNIQWAR
jgi:hypothetical protein